ncbi:MAG: molybdopterin-guanine dinucleotide biosynthesis protein B [Thermodesulfobacteriota bacterium]
MKTPALVSFVGPSNSGKTTLISRLIPVFKRKGLRVATIKHTGRDFSMDHPGKDTYLHKQAGADAVMIVSADRVALVADRQNGSGPEELARTHMSFADLVLVEGFKSSQLPKVWVYGRNREDSQPPPGMSGLVAVVGKGRGIVPGLPEFDPEEVEELAAFIESRFLTRTE